MADKNIGDLQQISKLNDESLLVVEQDGEARKMPGKIFREFAESHSKEYVESAVQASQGAKESAAASAASQKASEEARDEAGRLVSQALDAVENAATVEIGTVTEGDTMSVTNAGTKRAAKLNFVLRRGPQGPQGKNAYQYAVDAGYNGSEDEFSEKLAIPIITPEMFGAVGDGVTDDSLAIQTAIVTGANQSVPVYLAKKNYKISTGIFIRNNYDIFRCDGTITYDGTGAAVTLTGLVRGVVDINTIYAENGTAVKLDTAEGRVTFCHVSVNNIRKSKVGIHLTTTNTSALEPIYYNKLYFSDIIATEIGVFVEPITYLINENWYHGGTIGGGCGYAIKITAGAEYGSGANKFLSGGIEGVAAGGTAIYMEDSSNNIFRNIRSYELSGKTMIKFKGDCHENDIEMGLIRLDQVDISELGNIGNNYNILRSQSMSASSGFMLGREARVSKYGFTYDPKSTNGLEFVASKELFAGNVIQQIDAVKIPTFVRFSDTALSGETFVIGELYSEPASLARGTAITFRFDDGCNVKIVDCNGLPVIDNTDGSYSKKNVSVQWIGYSNYSGQNIWVVEEQGGDRAAKAVAEAVVGEHNADEEAHGDIRGSVADLKATVESHIDQIEAFLPAVPSEYQQLKYIQSDGNQYFDTGVLASDYPEGIRYVFEGVVLETDTSVSEYLFGALANGSRSGNVGLDDTNMRLSAIAGTEAGTIAYSEMEIGEPFMLEATITSESPHTMTMYKNGVEARYFIDEETKDKSSPMPAVNIFLLKVNGSSQKKYAIVQINRFSMYKVDGTPIRNLIPAYRKIDNVVGLYDTVDGTLHTNMGTGTLVMGGKVVSAFEDQTERFNELESRIESLEKMMVDGNEVAY